MDRELRLIIMKISPYQGFLARKCLIPTRKALRQTHHYGRAAESLYENRPISGLLSEKVSYPHAKSARIEAKVFVIIMGSKCAPKYAVDQCDER